MNKLYMILSLALILCFMVGCQDKAAMAELEEFNAQAALEKQNEAIIRTMVRLADEGKSEAWELISPDCVCHSGGKAYSLEEYGSKQSAMLHSAFPDLQHNIKDILTNRDKIVVYMDISGTHKGDYMGIAPTGKTATWTVIAIYRLSNGIVEEFWTEVDTLGIMQQLGFVLKPKEEK
jgi:predicted ester cyclase